MGVFPCFFSYFDLFTCNCFEFCGVADGAHDFETFWRFVAVFSKETLVFDVTVSLESVAAVKSMRVAVVSVFHSYLFGCLVHVLDELFCVYFDIPGVFSEI